MTTTPTTQDTLADYTAGNSEWNDEQKYASALWVRGTNVWTLHSTYDDPYEAVLPMLDMDTPNVVLEMFGWMNPVNEDGTPIAGEEERQRVRIAMALDTNGCVVGVQRLGEADFLTEDGTEGHFADFVNSARRIKEMAR